MDAKLPKIPDFKPSSTTAPPKFGSKPTISRRAKLSLVITGLLAVLIALSFFTKEPITIAKKAFTPAASKDAVYNRDVYQLDCLLPNKWFVPEAPSQSCVNNDTLTCGETCPPERQTTMVNPEGHYCCKPASTPTTDTTTDTSSPPSKTDSSSTDKHCDLPPKVSGVTVSCPACTSQ